MDYRITARECSNCGYKFLTKTAELGIKCPKCGLRYVNIDDERDLQITEALAYNKQGTC